MASSGYSTVSEFSNWESYFWPGTSVLKNLANERNQPILTDLELMATRVRGAEIASHPIKGDFDLAHLCEIHHHLFQDIYEWAGQLRTAPAFPVAMFKGGPSSESIAHGVFDADDKHPYRYFPAGEAMESHLKDWFARLNQIRGEALDAAAFASSLAEPWGEINAAHPFREGNTRAQVFFFAQFAAEEGHFLDYERFAKDEYFRLKFNAGRFLIQHDTDTSLLTEALEQIIDRRMTGKPRSRGGMLPAYEPHYISESD